MIQSRPLTPKRRRASLAAALHIFHNGCSWWYCQDTPAGCRLEPMVIWILSFASRTYAARMKELPHTHSCFVCGESNPIGLKLRFETDGRIVQTRFVARPEHVGFRQTVHGGLIATLLDEIMVWACAVGTKRFAFCAVLNLRFQNPLRPGEEVLATAELVEDRRGKIFETKSELQNEA